MSLETRINKITTGFQITIPADYRKQNHLKIGDYISFRQDKNKLVIEPLEKKQDSQKKNALKAFNDLFKQEISGDFDGLSEQQILKVVNKEIKLSRKKR
ncbi:MAG: AbrB/MazE/SpoVT family DNA-binding domain-containing protein [Pseudomonadota bacterium]